MTVEEMGRRMTAQEFGEWKAWFNAEQQHPADGRMQHAQLLASGLNGPVTRKTGGMFHATELMGPDPWAPPPPPQRQPSTAELAKQIEALNARMG